MEEMSLDYLLEAIEDTEYYPLFSPLFGYDDYLKFYIGIDDSMEPLLDELQDLVDFEFPGDLIYILLITNGGRIFDLNLYHLTEDKKDKNGLYFNNTEADTRKKYNIPDNYLIIGTSSDLFILCVTLDEEGFISYVLWDVKTKEIGLTYNYLVEVLIAEIDYYTGAFSDDETEETTEE